MSNYVGLGNQVINFHYRVDLLSEYQNYIFKNIFSELGVFFLDYNISGSNEITIKAGTSFVITPYNKDNIIIKVDLTEDIVVNGVTSSSPYIIARYNWQENNNSAVDFLHVNIPNSYDIVFGKAIFSGAIINNFDLNEQNKVKLNPTIMSASSGNCNTIIDSNANKLGGYTPGNILNNIPLTNSTLNVGLNAEYIGDTTNYVTAGNEQNKIAVKNSTLNVNLITEYLDNHRYDEFAKNDGIEYNINVGYLDSIKYDHIALANHTHNLNQINDGTQFIKIFKSYLNGNIIKTNGIENNALNNLKLSKNFLNINNVNKRIFVQYTDSAHANGEPDFENKTGDALTKINKKPFNSQPIIIGISSISYNNVNHGSNPNDNYVKGFEANVQLDGTTNNVYHHHCAGPYIPFILFGEID